MPDVALIALAGYSVAATVVVPFLLAKLVRERSSNTALRGYCLEHEAKNAELKPDAERGKRSRLQAARAPAAAQKVNRERIAAKAAAGAEG